MYKIKKEDRLCLLNPELLRSPYPFSNITEYCLGDRSIILSYLRLRAVDVDGLFSDYDLFCAVWNEIKNDSSHTAHSIRSSIERLIGEIDNNMSADQVWTAAADLFSQEKKLSVPNLGRLGIAVLPGQDVALMPERLCNTELVPVICPFGKTNFDYKMIRQRDVGELLRGYESVAVFAMGLEFEQPNQYMSDRAEEKLAVGQKLTDKEKRILSSQLFRAVALECSERKKELMIFLPPSPHISSMGELCKTLDYIDGVLTGESLRITVFAGDAVSMCFAASLKGKGYKKITAATGLCGNGCGLPDESCAKYWGIDEFPASRASLANSPAYIGS